MPDKNGLIPFIFCLLFSEALQAGVATDASLGTVANLSGPDFQIQDSLGLQVGQNLFFSFSEFSLQQGQSATFYGDDALRNVISRVSGSDTSFINGQILSLPPAADFWFVNPNGIVFGADASLDVGGTSHFSTANYIRFQNGGVFNTALSSQSQLTIAPPQAFGFTGETLGALELNQAVLAPNGDIDLVAGELNIVSANGALFSSGDRVNLLAISRGEVDVSGSEPVLSENAQAGSILLQGEAEDSVPLLEVNDAGHLYLVAGDIVLDGAVISANTVDLSGGLISIRANSISLINGAQIESSSIGNGRGSDIEITARDSVDLLGSELASSDIVSERLASGDAGSIVIQSSSLNMNASTIEVQPSSSAGNSVSTGGGDSGSIFIELDRLQMRNGSIISVSNLGDGEGGLISINASEFILLQDETAAGASYISADTEAEGSGGNILINSDKLTLDGAAIFAESLQTDEAIVGDAGNIVINVDTLILTPGGQITTRTFSSGNAGNVRINAADSISVIGNDELDSGIFSGTEGAGHAGQVKIQTATLNLAQAEIRADSGRNIVEDPDALGDAGLVEIYADRIVIDLGGVISSTSFGNGNGAGLQLDAGSIQINGGESNVTGIHATSHGSGSQASNIQINAATIAMNNNASITSTATGTAPAGSIDINVSNTLNMQNDSFITTRALIKGGEINITANGTVYLSDSIISAAADGDQRGENSGNVTLSGNQFVVLDNSDIEARAVAGDGGNIKLSSEHLIVSVGSSIDASSELGLSGQVEVQGLQSETFNVASAHQLRLAQRSKLLQDPCQRRRSSDRQQSSLLLETAQPRVIMRNGQLVSSREASVACTK